MINSFDAVGEVSGRSREVVLKTSRYLDSVLVQVQDNGKGWEDKLETFMFDPFFTTKKNGIGMGLTISRSIIENHGGRLWAERARPHGAILSFTVPIGTTPE
jgi:C4-dicarboxylate-specific signal transduction histidine kinase